MYGLDSRKFIYIYLQDVETDEFRFVESTFIWNDYDYYVEHYIAKVAIKLR